MESMVQGLLFRELCPPLRGIHPSITAGCCSHITALLLAAGCCSHRVLGGGSLFLGKISYFCDRIKKSRTLGPWTRCRHIFRRSNCRAVSTWWRFEPKLDHFRDAQCSWHNIVFLVPGMIFSSFFPLHKYYRGDEKLKKEEKKKKKKVGQRRHVVLIFFTFARIWRRRRKES